MNNRLVRNFAVIGLLVVAMFAMAQSASALQDLKITDYNKWYLANTAWTSYNNGWLPNAELLGWTAGQRLDAKYKKVKMVGSFSATTVADNLGRLWGECVSFGKAISYVDTGGYRKGKRVMDGGVAQGTVIGVFKSDGTYDSSGKTSHIAIFDTYLAGPGSVGFRVWDQNFVSPYAVGRHLLHPSGNGVYNANNYYVVQCCVT